MTPDEAVRILEFTLTAESNETSLKKHFKMMTLKYHPDRNKAPGATEKFIKIKEAYDALQKYLKQRQVPKQQQWADGASITINFSMNDGTFTTATNDSRFWSNQWWG